MCPFKTNIKIVNVYKTIHSVKIGTNFLLRYMQPM